MASIQIFDNPDFGTVRTLEEDNGAVLFAATDVAQALGYTNPRKAVSDHCRCITKRDVPHPQAVDKTIEMSFIPESDLYRLIFSSKLPNAERFTDWVTSEVLPSIRKHGSYTAGQANFDPNLPPELAMIEGPLNSMKQVCMTQKQQGTAIAQVAQRMDVMCEAMTTSANGDWRTACTNAIRAVAFKRGGGKHYEEVWGEVYDELLDNGFDIRRRLENRRKKAIAAGMSRSFVSKINALDVIAESKDKKLVSAFIASVRRIAAVESVRMDKLDSVAARQKMQRRLDTVAKKVPTLSVHDCCEIMRANLIPIGEPNLTDMIQAGLFPQWAVPSVGTKKAAPLISRAGFVAWVKEFYHLEEVLGA